MKANFNASLRCLDVENSLVSSIFVNFIELYKVTFGFVDFVLLIYLLRFLFASSFFHLLSLDLICYTFSIFLK